MKKTARGKNAAPPCPINAALLMLGDRWTLLIVRNLLFARATGFNEIQRAGEGMATNILTDYASDDADLIADLLMDADPKAYADFFLIAQRQAAKTLPTLLRRQAQD